MHTIFIPLKLIIYPLPQIILKPVTHKTVPKLVVVNPRNSFSTYKSLDRLVDNINLFDVFNRKYQDLSFSSKPFQTNRRYGKSSKKKLSFQNALKTIFDTNGSVLSSKSVNSFLWKRYGFGLQLASLITDSIGVNKSHPVLLEIVNHSYFYYNLSFFFKSLKISLDSSLAKSKNVSILFHKKLFTYKGWCFVNKYPVNGQKRRSNYKTSRKIRLLNLTRNISSS